MIDESKFELEPTTLGECVRSVFCGHIFLANKEPVNGRKWAVCNKCGRVACGTFCVTSKSVRWRKLWRFKRGNRIDCSVPGITDESRTG